LLSFIATLLIGCCTGALFIIDYDVFFIQFYTALLVFALTYFMLHEAKIITLHPKLAKLYEPIRIGLIVCLLATLFISIIDKNKYTTAEGYNFINVFFASITLILAVLYTVSTILPVLEITKQAQKNAIYALCSLLLLLTLFAPSISGALLIVLLSFRVNYKTGLAFGIVAFIYFTGQYYYDLSFSLLEKSLILLATGCVFLLFYFFTFGKNTQNGEL
jgi:uncharacterized membrane protein